MATHFPESGESRLGFIFNNQLCSAEPRPAWLLIVESISIMFNYVILGDKRDEFDTFGYIFYSVIGWISISASWTCYHGQRGVTQFLW